MLAPTIGRATGSASVVIVLVLGVSACSGPGAPRASETARAGDATLEHAGPWRADFEEALEGDVSGFERAVLEDGRVTSQELESAHSAVERCLADSGLGIEYNPDGGFALTSLHDEYPDGFFERSDPVLRACEGRYDEHITTLFEDTRRNPQKLDDATITVACLRKNHLVDEQYTARQFRKDYDEDTLPFSSFDPGWKQCDLDPLGLWRTP